MHVALIDPYYLAGNSPPSWVLGNLEAMLLEAGHQVIVRDFCGDDEAFSSLADFRRHEAAFATSVADAAAACDVIYFTTSFGVPQKPTPILARIGRLLEYVRERAPNVPIIIGGAQIDYLTVHGAAPSAVMGDHARGVVSFLTSDAQLVDCIATLDQRKSLNAGREIRILRDNAGRRVGATPPWPADALPKPEWAGWQLERYPSYRAALTSFGCRYGCSFCFESKQTFQALDMHRMLSGFLDTGVTQLAIEDSTLFGAHGLDNVVHVLEGLHPRGRYTCYALVAEVCRASPETLMRLRELGLESVILGIETPDDVALRGYKKSVTQERAKLAVDKLHSAGLTAQGCLMVGIPNVDLDTTRYTFEYARYLSLDVRRWHIFQPSFATMPHQIVTSEPVSIERFALVDVNVPDALLPELVETASVETLLEEHFLVRALAHMSESPEVLERVRYAAGYSLRDLYATMLNELRGSQASFNEEDYYAVLSNAHAGPGELRV
ncbi:B12-binding domain-containing radical SAM protein [Burkholderia sp. NLJ2]|uniref:B12-binding domain-containing radical SAM protein n=1 Tax=Burkholderia sp. NLJ2 TaxID=3090699 RepID=UPI003C6BEAA7